MPKLRVKRYVQDPACCAVASSASVANFYNKKIDYPLTKIIAEDMIGDEVLDGLYTGEIGLLLNWLGFSKVDIISSDINFLDFTLNKLSKKKKLEELKKELRVNKECKENIKSVISFLDSPEYKNKIVVDSHFEKYIKKNIDENKPFVLTFNWTLFFGMPKLNDKGEVDAHKGNFEEHAVVVNGYDDKGIFIVDSLKSSYTRNLKKYSRGKYHVNWADMMASMPFGDLIIPDDYRPEKMKYEFMQI